MAWQVLFSPNKFPRVINLSCKLWGLVVNGNHQWMEQESQAGQSEDPNPAVGQQAMMKWAPSPPQGGHLTLSPSP